MTSITLVADKIRQQIPDAKVEVYELDGKSDHLAVQVISASFKGKTLLEQHQMVNSAVQEELADATIHALQIKTITS
jgi:stress-induced morphogen